MTLQPQIVTDLDRNNPVLLVRVYLMAKRRHPGVPIEVTHSSSGVGYHIKIKKQVSALEDLKERALLWDDPYRLLYALKKWALNPDEAYVDLCFDEKNSDQVKGGHEKPIDMEKLLEPYKTRIDEIEEFLRIGEVEEAEQRVAYIAKEITPELEKDRRKQYVGCIAFKSDELREPLEEICTNIAAKDKTFSWRIYPCWFPEFDWILVVFADSEKNAWQKITWLKNRARKNKDSPLLLKNADTRLFVKERKAT